MDIPLGHGALKYKSQASRVSGVQLGVSPVPEMSPPRTWQNYKLPEIIAAIKSYECCIVQNVNALSDN